MSRVTTIVLSGGLSPKWAQFEVAVAHEPVVVSRCSGTPAEILAYSRRFMPSVLVVNDEFMHVVDTEEFIKAVDFGESIRVLVELEKLESVKAEKLVRLGCVGVLCKDATLAGAMQAVRAILAGELWVARKTASDLLLRLLCEARHRLTCRESEIVSLLEEGLKNHEIGERLFISPQTVRWHLRSIYSKLGTHDRIMARIRGRFLVDVRRGQHPVSQNGRVAAAAFTAR